MMKIEKFYLQKMQENVERESEHLTVFSLSLLMHENCVYE
jgi:hypothetical protein